MTTFSPPWQGTLDSSLREKLGVRLIDFRHLFLVGFASSLLALVACSDHVSVPESGPPSSDAVLNLYRNEHFRPLVLEYYNHLTENSAVAQAVLEACDDLAIAPSLAFALAWNESQFNPRAQHQNVGSVDRGLFQLNSRTFEGVSSKDVFDPSKNAHLGLAYFKKILDRLKTTEKALGYYNAGIGMLTDRPLPRSTVLYVARVLKGQKSMDSEAIAWLYFSHDPRVALR